MDSFESNKQDVEGELTESEKRRRKYHELVAALEINVPADILYLFDPDIQSGAITLNKWQIEYLSLACPRDATKDNPARVAIKAANGSGKSQIIVAPVAIFLCLIFDECQVVTTNASGVQLDKQAGRAIKKLARRINVFFREHCGLDEDVFIVQLRKIENVFTGSFLDLFATDESGKAEGWHPIKPGGRFAIIVDEAKTVTEEIYEALDRCNGYTDLIYVSSTGAQYGTFYQACTKPELGFKVISVTAYDNTHLAEVGINIIINKYGISHPFVRSSIFSEFVADGNQVVLPLSCIERSQKLYVHKPSHDFGRNRAGLDLSGGGDDQVLSIWRGCRMIAEYTFNLKFAPDLRDQLIPRFKQHDILASDIWADDGGAGEIFLDMLQEAGWEVNRVLNQSKANDWSRYANRGAELWFNFKRFVEENLVLLLEIPGNRTLIDQLANRYFKIQTGTGKIVLESKKEAKANGHPSPDHADAAVLAWANYMFPLDELMEKSEPTLQETLNRSAVSQSAYETQFIADRNKKLLAILGSEDAKKQPSGNIDSFGRYKKKQFTLSARKMYERTGRNQAGYGGVSTNFRYRRG